MKNKLFLMITFIFFLFFGSFLNAEATISSEEDIMYKINQLENYSYFDPASLINKNELVGNRYDDFRMVTSQYMAGVTVIKDYLKNTLNQIEITKNSEDYSDTEKKMQIQSMYYEADSTLRQLNTNTIDYLAGLRSVLPSISYSKFIRRFQDYYNGLDISGSSINVY